MKTTSKLHLKKKKERRCQISEMGLDGDCV